MKPGIPRIGSTWVEKQTGSTDTKKRTGSTDDMKRRTGSTDMEKRTGSTDMEKRTGSTDMEKRTGSTDMEKRTGSTDMERQTGSTCKKKHVRVINIIMKPNSEETKKLHKLILIALINNFGNTFYIYTNWKLLKIYTMYIIHIRIHVWNN